MSDDCPVLKPDWPPKPQPPGPKPYYQADFKTHLEPRKPEYVVPIIFRRRVEKHVWRFQRWEDMLVNLQLPSKTVSPGDWERACQHAPVQPDPLPDPRDLKLQMDRIEARLGLVLQFLSELNFYVSYHGRLPFQSESCSHQTPAPEPRRDAGGDGGDGQSAS